MHELEYELDMEFSNEHSAPAGYRDPIWPGRWGESTLWFFSALQCLWLANEALLIQIRVNDYLIIPILQRAPSLSVLCLVNLQRSSVSCHFSMPRLEWADY